MQAKIYKKNIKCYSKIVFYNSSQFKNIVSNFIPDFIFLAFWDYTLINT